jgi:hypothetical protein
MENDELKELFCKGYKMYKNSKSYNMYCVECCYKGYWENDG